MAELNKKSRKGNKETSSLLAFFQKHKVKIAAVAAGTMVLVLVAGYATGMIGNRSPENAGDDSIALAQSSDADENAEALPQEVRTYGDPFTVGTDNDPFAGPMKLVGVLLDGQGGHLAIIEAGGTAYIVSRGTKIAGYWTVLSIRERAVEMRSDDKDMTLQLVDR